MHRENHSHVTQERFRNYCLLLRVKENNEILNESILT